MFEHLPNFFMKLLPQSYKTPFCQALKTFQNVKLQIKTLAKKSPSHLVEER
jgi:hypothetical protein